MDHMFDIHDGVDSPTVPLPHGSEPWLTPKVPTNLKSDKFYHKGSIIEASLVYHFKVTWPLCTRFILKPTVGIELQVIHSLVHSRRFRAIQTAPLTPQ